MCLKGSIAQLSIPPLKLQQMNGNCCCSAQLRLFSYSAIIIDEWKLLLLLLLLLFNLDL